MKPMILPTTLALLAFVAAACVPNRLAGSLTPSPPATPGSTAVVNQSTPTTAGPTTVVAPGKVTPNQPEPAPTPSGRNLQPQLALAQIDPDEVVSLLPPDAIRAIMPDEVAKIMVSAAQADANGMEPGTRVLGVSINGDSRAYPIPYMSSHEIVNDEVGGRLIAATW